MTELTWTRSSTDDVPEAGAERFFNDLRLLRAGKTVWAWYADYMPVAFPFGDLTSLFDESADASGGTQRLIASPPMAYLLIGEGRLELDDVTTGEYRLTWIDFATGQVSEGSVQLDGGEEAFDAPVDGVVGLALQRIGL